MHASFRSCARSSWKAMFGFFLICAPLLQAQNTTVPVDAKKELPDAPMPVTSTSPPQNNLSFRRGALPPSSGAGRTQGGTWMGMSPAIERPKFNMNALASEKSRPGGKELKVPGRSIANRFSFEPIGGHANRSATHGANEWYTSHIPLAGSIMRQGLKISKAHPHLTTVIKTIKPKL